MLAESVVRLGGDPVVFDPGPDSPAGRRFAGSIRADWTDAAALGRLFDACDVVTYEFENVATAGLRSLPDLSKLAPSIEVLETTQNRGAEKAFLRGAGLPVPEFALATGVDEVMDVASRFGLPAVLKTATGGYDGKGQWVLRTAADLEAARPAIAAAGAARAFVLEELVDLVAECSVIVARDRSGAEVVFPVFENFHADHILDRTVIPARIPPELDDAARRIALEAARRLGVVGLLTTELFVGRSLRGDPSLRIFVNEFAPRPHNSGHVTRVACEVSQFDLHARVLVGAPLVAPAIRGRRAYCMANLLGDVWLAQGRSGGALDLAAWRDFPDVLEVYLYGKAEARAGRKMGHLIAAAESAEAALARAGEMRDALRLRS